MIETRIDHVGSAVRYVLRPNQSWTWKANLWFLAVLCSISLSIAASFALRGYWMILPFSVLELSVLLACLWLCVRRGYRQEVIVLEPERVTLQTGQRDAVVQQADTRQFERFYTRFHVEPNRHPWREKRVLLRYRDERFEIGSFLPTDEKRELISALKKGIRYVDGGLAQ